MISVDHERVVYSLADAKAMLAKWKGEYNTRCHMANIIIPKKTMLKAC